MSPNPFTPSFGVSPPLLVGRDETLALFAEAIEDGPGSSYRATLFTGPRGSGKTVMLNALEDVARGAGWVVLSEAARPGLAQQMAATSVPGLLQDHPEAIESFVTGLEATAAGFGGGVDRERVERFPVTPNLRSQLTVLADLLARQDAGVLLTVDEVDKQALADLQEITQVVQHLFREGRPLMFAAAGLPAQVLTLLEAPGTTFLRRAERIHLGPVPRDEVARAIAEPMLHAGKGIDGDALEVTVAGTQGYPFMVQLVGSQAWQAARDTVTVTLEQAADAVASASRRVGQLVHEPALARLSPVDRTYLAAMAVDDGPSRTSDIAGRMGVNAAYAGQYRLRLLDAELIHATEHGRVDFSLPYLREYLREHATHDVLSAGEQPPGGRVLDRTVDQQRRRPPRPDGDSGRAGPQR